MYENLVAWLRDKDFEPICPCGDESICEGKDCAVLQAADAIEELQGRAKVLEKIADKWCDAVPKWIPVTERLPEVFKHVLVNIPGMTPHPTVQEAFREKNGMWYSNGFRYGADEITHWMPLPEPPEGGADCAC